MASLVWPIDTLPPQTVLFSRRGMSTSGGRSVNGTEQVVRSSADVWRAKLTAKIVALDQADIYRSLMAQADGRAGLWLIPSLPTRPQFTVLPTLTGLFLSSFSDSSTFSDGSQFLLDVPLVEQLASALAASSGASGTRSLSIIANSSTPPQPGQYFSIGERLYVVATVTAGAPGAYTLSFRPGLREAVALGASLNFATPACRMRLATDDTGDMNLDLLRFAPVSLDFVEAY